ncbi:Uncharacterized protein FWK35_00031762 [Aphis craccivora]|uniref:C2H2-type domain-containing protein n=1 Tax=Aphis craccivora TaxID=307492 RepID=A0A6G0WDQ6_APHCR|nr:Uncharacterized protein FWK35_00031762 [Aphis craccivora]
MKCNTSFSKKLNLIKHIRHEMQISTSKGKLICSFEECNKIFSSFKTYQLHLNIRHMVDINNDTLNFEIFEDHFIQGFLANTHLWHQNEIGKLRLTTADRAQLAGKLSLGVPIQRVLNDVRDSAEGSTLNRFHLIEKRDLHNIKRDYNINKCLTKRHENDFMSVQLWAKQLAKGSNNPVSYFKHQGQDDVTTQLGKDDFFGIIKSYIFMSDDEPEFYNAWCSVMGPVSKQLLCTWHVLRSWNKNLSKIHCHEKKAIVFKTLKSLLYETDEKSLDTADFGNYFVTTYSSRIEK